MRKKVLNGKRVLALALAFSMLVGETAFAAPGMDMAAEELQAEEAYVQDTEGMELSSEDAMDVVSANGVSDAEKTAEDTSEDEGQTEDIVNSDDLDENEDEKDTEDSQDTEDAQEDEESEELDTENAWDGSVSQVIGLTGSVKYYTMTDDDGNEIKYAYCKSQNYNNYLLPGKLGQYIDAATGLVKYNGKYYYTYSSEEAEDVHMYSSYEAIPVSGTDASYKDAATGLYKVNGVDYSSMRYKTVNGVKKYYVRVQDACVYGGTFANYSDFKAKSYVKGAYYILAGRTFRNASGNTVNGKYVAYGNLNQEIAINGQNINLSWTSLSTDEYYVNAAGEYINVGYQVEENGNMHSGHYHTADGKYGFYPSTYTYESDCVACLMPGQSAKYRVRGLYYTRKKVNGDYVYTVVKEGPWSEPYTYTAPSIRKNSLVTGLSAKWNGTTIDMNWNMVPEIGTYNVEIIKSKTPLNITKDNWDSMYSSNAHQSEYSYNSQYRYTIQESDKQNGYKYFYVAVGARYTEDVNGLETDDTLSAPVSVTISANANVPQVQNFRVVYKENGMVELRWTPVDANVVVFYTKLSSLPKYFDYNFRSPKAIVNGKTKYFSSTSDAATVEMQKIVNKKVDYKKYNGLSGCTTISPALGETYYYTAFTYDVSLNSSDYPKATSYATIDGINYNIYTDMSTPSATVAVKSTPSKPIISSYSKKNSIQLNMSGNGTGYEIYRKNGKKYKKITVTTDCFYIDSNLKADKKYSYKIRSYYYDKDSKKTCYSGYTYYTAETSSINNISLSVSAKNAKSVNLKWTKVPGAVKYEIYRTSECSENPFVESKSFTAAKNQETYLRNYKYTLIKTITKAGTTKYTDKSVKAGESYEYMVMAYYKNDKKMQYVTDSDFIDLYVSEPQNLNGTIKGSTATVSWTPDKYASQYEISYKISDTYGNGLTKGYVYATTKKTKYSIGGVPAGGSVDISVRSYGKNKKYSSWSQPETIYSGAIGVSSKLTASNAVAVLPSGAKKDAIKLTWKPVSGAKYYKVYRTTKKPTYNKDTKRYEAYGDTIAKEANDNEGNNKKAYREYLNKIDTIVGTTAYDMARLDTGVTYYYMVVAYDVNDDYAYFSSTDNTCAGALATVTYKGKISVKLKNAKKKQVTVSYDKVNGAKTYTIYRAEKKGKKTGAFKKVGTSKKTSYVDKKVSKGKTYYYKVVATGTTGLKSTLNIESSKKSIKVKK